MCSRRLASLFINETPSLGHYRDRDRTAFARIRLDADGIPGPIEVVAARDDAELSELKIDEEGKTASLEVMPISS
jgi:hypothetical protein